VILLKVLSHGDMGSGATLSSVSQQTVSQQAEWMDEVRCLMLANHRSVIRLVGLVTSGDPLYIVTELAARGSLKDCLRHSDLFMCIGMLLDVCTQVAHSCLSLP